MRSPYALTPIQAEFVFTKCSFCSQPNHPVSRLWNRNAYFSGEKKHQLSRSKNVTTNVHTSPKSTFCVWLAHTRTSTEHKLISSKSDGLFSYCYCAWLFSVCIFLISFICYYHCCWLRLRLLRLLLLLSTWAECISASSILNMLCGAHVTKAFQMDSIHIIRINK